MLLFMSISTAKKSPKTFDQLAELQVAGLFAEEGWNVYFPHRDNGFDFVAIKNIEGTQVIRPVQVKGKYPEDAKKDRPSYGYTGRLSQQHCRMVLAIPYFNRGAIPKMQFVAFMPKCEFKEKRLKSGEAGIRCEPAKFADGSAEIRPQYVRYFDKQGLQLLESKDWGDKSIKGSDAPSDCADVLAE